MTQTPHPFSRGSTFSFGMAIPEQLPAGYLKSYTPVAHLRKARNDLPSGFIAKLDCFWADPSTTRVLVFHHALTEKWPVGLAEMDVLFRSDSGHVLRSTVVSFIIQRGITK